MTEAKHTRGKLNIQSDTQLYAADKSCVANVYGLSGRTQAEANAARLVSGWNLQNRLEEMGVSDAVAEIQKLRGEIQEMKDNARDAKMERNFHDD